MNNKKAFSLWLKILTTAIVGLLSVTIILISNIADAAPPPPTACNLNLDTPVIANLTATLSGAGACTNYKSNVSNYQVSIDWGDASTTDNVANTFADVGNGNDFSGNWGPAPHTFSQPGIYNVAIYLCHSNCNGNDQPINNSITIPGGLPVGPTNTPPQITILGDNPLSLYVGDVFADPGVTVNDAEDGDLTASVATSSDVDAATIGAYAVAYSVTDSGLLSAYATRTVNVLATTTPTSTPSGTISGFKFNDLNNNGVWDGGESGLADWIIILSQDGVTLATTTTDGTGAYSFANLATSTYGVSETNQAGWEESFPGGDGTYTVTISEATTSLTDINFGNYQTPAPEGMACGYKFHDQNANGVWDEGEEPLPDVDLRLTEDISISPETFAATSDENGYFCFAGFTRTGSYTLSEIISGWLSSVGIPQSLVIEDIINPGGLNSVGNYVPSMIRGVKWFDNNGNGLRDEGENGLVNWPITLANLATTATTATTTNALGDFVFDGLKPGSYQVSEAEAGGYVQTYPGGAGVYNLTLISSSTASTTIISFGNALVTTIGTSSDDNNSNPDPGTGGGGGGGGCRRGFLCSQTGTTTASENTTANSTGPIASNSGGGNPPAPDETGGNTETTGTNPSVGGEIETPSGATGGGDNSTVTETRNPLNQTAAVGAAGSIFSLSWWVWLIILLVVGGSGYYLLSGRRQ